MTPTPEDIAHRIIDAATGLFTVAHPDPDRAHVFVWSSGAPEQLAAIIESELAPLRELAEIGRLAVEEEKLRCALKAKYMASGGKTDGCMGLYDDFYKASITHREAVCAYLAKQEESKP